jgi:hypothetical protein
MAEEDFSTGATASEAPDPVQGVKDAALSQMARDEDISNYKAEREARDAEAKGEEVNGEDRGKRIREALEQARADTDAARKANGIGEPDLDAQYQDAEAQWQEAQEQEATFEQERQAAVDEGRFQAVAENLKAANPQVWGQITDTMKVIDTMLNDEQSRAIVRGFTKGNATEGMQVAYRLSQPSYDEAGNMLMTPEQKIQYLASMPPAQLESTLDQARTYLQLEGSISKQLAARYAAQGKRHTSAPPPFTRPRGGANPPKDINALARKSDVSDYAKVRRQQMKARDE